MARLRREEKARAYERMINPPSPLESFGQRFPNSNNKKLFAEHQAQIDAVDEFTYADVNRQLALIINVLLSIVACSVTLWMVSSHWSTSKRLGLSMGGSVVVGIAEVALYASYLRKLKEARAKGTKQIEIKKIMKTWIIGSETKEDEDNIAMFTPKDMETRIRKRYVKSG